MNRATLLDFVLKTSLRGKYYLVTLGALHMRELRPHINTKDEFKGREIMIKLKLWFYDR